MTVLSPYQSGNFTLFLDLVIQTASSTPIAGNEIWPFSHFNNVSVSI
jgi:hypothetical protein